MSRKDDAYLSMNSDDERASRVLALAIKFFGARLPVSSTTLHAELYPTLDGAAFQRQYLRDRQLLSSLGIVVREAGMRGTEMLWKVDEDISYAKGDGVGARDARLLYVLCHDMAFDQAFPYRDELRMALAKISQMYRGSIITTSDTTPTWQRKILAVLVSCLTARHGVAVTYTDAQGAISNRTLAIFGSFGLWGNTYFVASRMAKDGTLVPDTLRTYRLDRFSKARELDKLSYDIPADFSVNDYERLPFQMGDAVGSARLDVGRNPSRTVTHAMAIQGSVDEDGLWSIWYSNLYDLASWCVGEGVTPLDPPQLQDAYHTVLDRSCAEQAFDASLAAEPDEVATQAQRKARGRSGSVLIVKQLMALATSLTHEGDVVTAHDIAQTLGISFDQARHLIALVSMGSGESSDYLPVVLGDDDDEVSLMEGANLAARRIRLTQTEATALLAALSEVGVPADDPLAAAIHQSFAPREFSLDSFSRSLELPSSSSDAANLKTCSKAIDEGMALAFDYTPVSGGPTRVRHVIPARLRRSDDSWYLDAFDLDRQDDRVFRVDRMCDLQVKQQDHAVQTPVFKHSSNMVDVRFCEPHYLLLFNWEGLEKIEDDERGVLVRLPSYGGVWLARHLAACAGTVQVSDHDLAEQIRACATELRDLPSA